MCEGYGMFKVSFLYCCFCYLQFQIYYQFYCKDSESFSPIVKLTIRAVNDSEVTTSFSYGLRVVLILTEVEGDVILLRMLRLLLCVVNVQFGVKEINQGFKKTELCKHSSI